jgi:hypothetical protein
LVWIVTPDDIIQALEFNRRSYPRQALLAAAEQCEAVTPVLPQTLAWAADEPEGLVAQPGSETLSSPWLEAGAQAWG